MPWTPAQIRLFLSAAHNPAIAKRHGMSQAKAREMGMESSHKERKIAMALSGKRQ